MPLFHKMTAEEIAKAGGPTPPWAWKMFKWSMAVLGVLTAGFLSGVAVEVHQQKKARLLKGKRNG